jgi:hypothetical protein
MADDLKDLGAADHSRINMSDQWEVEYRTRVLGVSKERLASIIVRVGSCAEAVRRGLGK